MPHTNPFLLTSLLLAFRVFAGETLSEGSNGLAAKYPGDAGIEKDPDVVFVENFEAGSMDAVLARWEDLKDKQNFALVGATAPGSAGKNALLQTHTGGQGTGGGLYRRLMPGYSQLFARFYVKFDTDCFPIHHFGTTLGGNLPATRWPQVKAGINPPGDKGFWVGIEPFGDAWRWDYYAYWVDMRGSPPRGQKWGNSFIRDPNIKVTRGQWQCVEFMLKMNTFANGEARMDGEMALWIDGKRISHLGPGFPNGFWTHDKFTPAEDGDPFGGFRWRTAEALNLNFVWLYVYITKAPDGHVSKVWFDDVVVAKKYIGPLAK